MDDKNITERLKKIKITDNDKIDALGAEIVKDSRADAKELVKILHSGNEEEAQKASMVLMSIGDLLITPMLESLDADNADNYAWETDIILTAHLSNRNKIAVIFNSMFADKRKLKGPQLKGAVEEKPIPRRVCDEAYLMLRRMTAFKESQEDIMTNERLFLSMKEEEKDKEIERLKNSSEWISLSEHFGEQDEF